MTRKILNRFVAIGCILILTIDLSGQTNDRDAITHDVPPAFWAIGMGVDNYITASFPNIHLKSAFTHFFTSNKVQMTSEETRGIYLGLYMTGGDKSRLGLRAIYLLRSIDRQINFYPLVQVGYRTFTNEEKDTGTGTEIRVGGGIHYAFKQGKLYKLFAEVGTGVSPVFAGITLPFLQKQ